MTLTPLPRVMVEPLVRAALLEDLGRAGDITTDAIVPADATATMVLAARQPGVIAGLDMAALAFELMDPRTEVAIVLADGSAAAAGDVVATVHGPARALLTPSGRRSICFAISAALPRKPRRSSTRCAAPRPRSSARERPRLACVRWRSMLCAPAAAPITASASTTPC